MGGNVRGVALTVRERVGKLWWAQLSFFGLLND